MLTDRIKTGEMAETCQDQTEVVAAVVGFLAGLLHNIFMANVRFLELLGHLPIDILLLSNSPGVHGRWNMGGTSTQYHAPQWFKTLLAAKDIRPRCYIGASAGAEFALVAAKLDQLRSLIRSASALHCLAGFLARGARLHSLRLCRPLCLCVPAGEKSPPAGMRFIMRKSLWI